MEVGTIVRVDDIEAESKVKSGYYKYVPKSEYKVSKPKVEEVKATEPVKTISDSVAIGYGLKQETISEKQLRRGKTKAK